MADGSADGTTKEWKVGFARKQLEKHGWCEGKGLGKEESGISKAIKVNIKTDSAGVGYDAGDQFSFHWWDHVFNKTAKSIVVQESEEGVEVVKSSKETCIVSNKRPSKNSKKPLLYGRFVKASSQIQENDTQESDEDSESEKDFSHLCPEDRLFQACGGRTAHKAARHGLRLNGKLQRVEEQEKLGNAADRCKTNTTEYTDSDHKGFVGEETQRYNEKENKNEDRKKKKRKNRDMPQKDDHKVEEKCNSCEIDVYNEKQGKKKKRKWRNMQEENDTKPKDKCNSCDDVDGKSKKNKKRKSKDAMREEEHKLGNECSSFKVEVDEKKAKKKKAKHIYIN